MKNLKSNQIKSDQRNGNQILDEANEKLWITLQNKDLTTVSVA